MNFRDLCDAPEVCDETLKIENDNNEGTGESLDDIFDPGGKQLIMFPDNGSWHHLTKLRSGKVHERQELMKYSDFLREPWYDINSWKYELNVVLNFLIDPGGLLDEFIKIDPWGQGSFEGGETVEALTKLGEMFSSGTEESLNTFSAGSFVLVLIDLLNYKSKPYIMLLAARELTHSCDVLSFSCIAIVHCVMVSVERNTPSLGL